MRKHPHAVLSASGSSRFLACAGSIRMSEGIPSTTSVYAFDGSCAHVLAETCLEKNDAAARYVGTQMKCQGKAFTITLEMAEAVQIYLDAVWASLIQGDKGTTLDVEKKFKLDWLYPGLYGTCDAVVSEPFGKISIFDLKYGQGVAVEAKNNSQAMYYALGGSRGGIYEEVELVIVQPRAFHPDGPVRRFRMPIEDLEKWGQEVLLPGAKATENPDAPLVVGDHCRFCPALAICPKQRENAMEVAKNVFLDVPKAPPVPEAMTQLELRKVLDVADTVDAWFNACRAYAKSLLETGKATDDLGYKLVHGRKTRSWVSDDLAQDWLESILGQEAYSKKLLTVAQAEKVLKDPAHKVAFPNYVKETRGVQLAPVSDNREAITGASDIFGEVEL